MPLSWTIDADIRRAATLPAEVYSDPRWFAAARERVFARSWQLVADTDAVRVPGASLPVHPARRDPRRAAAADPRRAATRSTACRTSAPTAATLVCEHAGVQPALRCRYHGRRFGLDGRFLSMPEFEGAEGFPSPADNLPKVPFGTWGSSSSPRSIPPSRSPSCWPRCDARVGWLPLARGGVRSRPLARLPGAAPTGRSTATTTWRGSTSPTSTPGSPARSTTASTAPSSSPGPTCRWASASGGEDVFDLPAGSPDDGQRSPPTTSGSSPTRC